MISRPKLAAALAAILVAQAMTATPAAAQPEWGRPLTPEENRRLNATIDRLSGQLNVRNATLQAIARALGVNLRNIGFDRLIQLVGERAQEAATLRTRLAQLETQLRALPRNTATSEAQQALQRATAAFNEGRLEDAQREFRGLAALRRSGSMAGLTAWSQAVDAEARIAELRLDFDTTANVRLEAAEQIRRTSVALQWSLNLGAANAYLLRGIYFDDRGSVERAIRTYEEKVIPLVPKGEWPSEWANSQVALGIAKATLGWTSANRPMLLSAISALESGLAGLPRERDLEQWARAQGALGMAYGYLGENMGDRIQLDKAVTTLRTLVAALPRGRLPLIRASAQGSLGSMLALTGGLTGVYAEEEMLGSFREAADVFRDFGMINEWASMKGGLGTALAFIGSSQGSIPRLEQALSAYREWEPHVSRSASPLGWASVQGNIGHVNLEIGSRTNDAGKLREAIGGFKRALEVQTEANGPAEFARTNINLGFAYSKLARLDRDHKNLDAALRHIQIAIPVVRKIDHEALSKYLTDTILLMTDVTGELGPRAQDTAPGDLRGDVMERLAKLQRPHTLSRRASRPQR